MERRRFKRQQNVDTTTPARSYWQPEPPRLIAGRNAPGLCGGQISIGWRWIDPRTLRVELGDPERGAATIERYAADHPLDAVVGSIGTAL